MLDRTKAADSRRVFTFLLVLVVVDCSGSTSTGLLLDSGIDGAVSAGDLGGQDDLGALVCTGNESFQAARTAMLGGCSGFGQFSCHGRSPFGGGLDLTAANAYQDLVAVPATIAPTKMRVQPGNPAVSFLVQKLTNTQGSTEGGPMPQPVEGLRWAPPDPAKLNTIRCWIENGAKNN